ncbi:MAG: dihydroorotate dehydrogenase electron transfer subunit [Rikenellaceae bacterium]
MYKRGLYRVAENIALTSNVYSMRLEGDTQYITAPGQFVNVEIAGCYLRRPISVCDYGDGWLRIIYKVVGEGTKALSEMKVNECADLDVLTGLGNGFSTKLMGHSPLLVGGGVGVPPMYNLCKVLLAAGKKPTVLLGFNTASELFLVEEFEALGVDVVVTTIDGTHGVKGVVTTALEQIKFDFVYACGPLPMLKALYDATPNVDGEFSFEERMGCGFGACVGCTCKTKYGYKRICKDGPVLDKEEIIW